MSASQRIPKASVSHADRFGSKSALAIDGKVNFLPTPTNRWTSYESPNETDWLEVDFGEAKTFRRIELGIYDDRGGVQPPSKYEVEYWDGNNCKPVADAKKSPEKPPRELRQRGSFHAGDGEQSPRGIHARRKGP